MPDLSWQNGTLSATIRKKYKGSLRLELIFGLELVYILATYTSQHCRLQTMYLRRR